LWPAYGFAFDVDVDGSVYQMTIVSTLLLKGYLRLAWRHREKPLFNALTHYHSTMCRWPMLISDYKPSVENP
jgi:hypothetical protein